MQLAFSCITRKTLKPLKSFPSEYYPLRKNQIAAKIQTFHPSPKFFNLWTSCYFKTYIFFYIDCSLKIIAHERTCENFNRGEEDVQTFNFESNWVTFGHGRNFTVEKLQDPTLESMFACRTLQWTQKTLLQGRRVMRIKQTVFRSNSYKKKKEKHSHATSF